MQRNLPWWPFTSLSHPPSHRPANGSSPTAAVRFHSRLNPLHPVRSSKHTQPATTPHIDGILLLTGEAYTGSTGFPACTKNSLNRRLQTGTSSHGSDLSPAHRTHEHRCVPRGPL